MKPDERVQNYIKRMSHFRVGHPISDPDNFTEDNPLNEVRVGDVGFFHQDNTWRRMFNVFELRDAPDGYKLWDSQATEYKTHSPNDTIGVGGFMSLDFSLSGISGNVSPPTPAPGVTFKLEQRSSSAAALIVPATSLHQSFDDTRLDHIEKAFIRDHEKWFRHARDTEKRSNLKIWNLVLVFAVVKTSHWALASAVKKKLSANLSFNLSPSVIQVGVSIWGDWHHSPGALVKCGPKGDAASLQLLQQAEAVAAALPRQSAGNASDSSDNSEGSTTTDTDDESEADPNLPSSDPSPSSARADTTPATTSAAEQTQVLSSVDPFKNRPQDRCVFMIRLKMWRIFYNPFKQKYFKLKMGSGPSNNVDELTNLMNQRNIGGGLSWEDFPPERDDSEEGGGWMSVLQIQSCAPGIGNADTREAAREAAAGDVLAFLRSTADPGESGPAGAGDADIANYAARDDDPSDLYDARDDEPYPPSLEDLYDPLDILLRYTHDVQRERGDATVKYAAATDRHVAAFLTHANMDLDFKTIIYSAKPEIEVLDGVARVRLPEPLRGTNLEDPSSQVDENAAPSPLVVNEEELRELITLGQNVLTGKQTAKLAVAVDGIHTTVTKTEGLPTELLLLAWEVLVKLVLKNICLPSQIILQDVKPDLDERNRPIPAQPAFSSRDPTVPTLGFNTVFRGMKEGKVVAMKRLLRSNNISDKQQSFWKEILVLSQLRNDHIVPFLGVTESTSGNSESLSITCPWYVNGNVDELLRRQPELKELLYPWVTELVEGMQYLHTRQVPVIHGDLNTTNLLIDDERHVRIAGFGSAELVPIITHPTTRATAGSLFSKAPELIVAAAGTGNQPSLKSKATDVWALGCTIYTMYEGKIPYARLVRGQQPADHARVRQAIQRGDLPGVICPKYPASRESMPEQLWRIVNRCWVAAPGRPTVGEISAGLA